MIMQDRIQKAAEKNCSAIDPDNVDAFSEKNQNGIGATKNDSILFVKFLADEAHSRGMGIALKNSLEILPDVSSIVDLAVNEQCMSFNECGNYTKFLAAGKPVVNIEYPQDVKPDRRRAVKPDDQISFKKEDADARCTKWLGLHLHNLATTLKGYPTISCGVSRCVLNGTGANPLPAVPSGGPLPVPAGCRDA